MKVNPFEKLTAIFNLQEKRLLVRGFVEYLVLVEVLAEVSVEVEVAADLGLGGRFKLALNCRKDGYYAKR